MSNRIQGFGLDSNESDSAAPSPVVDVGFQVASHDAWIDPRPQSRYHPDFRNAIHERESMPTKNRRSGYGAFNLAGAWGRYQMTKGALQDVRMMNDNGKWSGLYGIRTDEDFLNNPEIQEQVFEEYADKLLRAMESSAVRHRLDKEIQGIKASFPVTKAGIIAASHRRGAQGVRDYFSYLEERNWKSDVDTIQDPDRRQKFLDIETRLREFSGVPLLWKQSGPN